MKLNLKTDYWDKTTEWQFQANKNLWWVIMSAIIMTLQGLLLKDYVFSIFIAILCIIYTVPQKLTYNKWHKQYLHNKYKPEEEESKDIEMVGFGKIEEEIPHLPQVGENNKELKLEETLNDTEKI